MKNQQDSPSRQEAEEAIRTLIRWIGENPAREDLIDTPSRVLEAFGEHFSGYAMDVQAILARSFNKAEAYDDFVLLKRIPFVSHCEHHIAPFHGFVHLAYWPQARIVGLSKLARIVDVFAKRLQTQESMTTCIALAISENLNPKGVAVLIEAEHQCISMRGIKKEGVLTSTSKFLGIFQEDAHIRQRFLALC